MNKYKFAFLDTPGIEVGTPEAAVFQKLQKGIQQLILPTTRKESKVRAKLTCVFKLTSAGGKVSATPSGSSSTQDSHAEQGYGGQEEGHN
jgi:hypothetical protein